MEQFIDHHSFLVENNLLTDEMKDNIAMAGYCIVENVIDAATSIDFNEKNVEYNLLIPGELYNNLRLLEKFQNGDSIGFWNSRKLRNFLKKKREIEESNNAPVMGYKLDYIANKFVKSYLSDKWSASVEIFNADSKDERENFELCGSGDKQIN